MRNPRVAITLKPSDYEALKELAELTDQPMSRLLGEMVDIAMPSLKVLKDNLYKVKQLDNSIKLELAQGLDKAIEANEDAIRMLYEVLEDKGNNPPSSNTGVTPL